MQLTVDQALQKAIAAHQEGKLQDAERFYRAILEVQPAHADANHNLGVLAVSVSNPEAALPLFKKALDANSGVEQFWCSYIDCLIKTNSFAEAKIAIDDGKQAGVAESQLALLKQELQLVEQGSESSKKLPSSFKEKREQQRKKKRGEKQVVEGRSPSQQQIDTLFDHYQANRLPAFEALASSMTEEFPEHHIGWKALAIALKKSGRLSESLAPMRRTAELCPEDAEAHSNLGVTFLELGRLEESEESLQKAVALKPDYAEAHFNLGNTLRERGRVLEALTSYGLAISHRPDYVSALANFGSVLQESRFSSSAPNLYSPLTTLFSAGNFVRPKQVAKAVMSLLSHDPVIRNLLAHISSLKDLESALSAIDALNHLPLLHCFMRICSLPDLQMEQAFTAIRSVLLINIEELEATSELTHFLTTLSLHCFVNEYVYAEAAEETAAVARLEAGIACSIEREEQPSLMQILCLSSYRPISRYGWSERLNVLDELEELNARLIREPIQEEQMAASIPALSCVSDRVSRSVRSQYEKNPYPRWLKLSVPVQAKSVTQICEDLSLRLCCEAMENFDCPQILIAGCGTGQQAIETASRFANCSVTAVDLSSASLAYAKRKSAELEISNIQYLHADILELGELQQEFDVIESVGVLHHMRDPMAGWAVLAELLRPGGLIKIGLYSQMARQSVANVRDEIASQRIGSSEEELRQFRESLIRSHSGRYSQIKMSDDFFSLSEFRDLLFHVQEHCFTLPEIRCRLVDLGLRFCGFENKKIRAHFMKHHGAQADINDLQLWHELEESAPTTFAGMYQFWCQKPC